MDPIGNSNQRRMDCPNTSSESAGSSKSVESDKIRLMGLFEKQYQKLVDINPVCMKIQEGLTRDKRVCKGTNPLDAQLFYIAFGKKPSA